MLLSLCLDIFRRTPIPIIFNTKEEPPALIKGRGTPVTGIEPVTTAMFMMACIAIIEVIPTAKRVPKLFFALYATLIPLQTNIRKSTMINRQPMSPNSSPMIEKIKSLCGSGI